jgi:hypothetical protein
MIGERALEHVKAPARGYFCGELGAPRRTTQ